MGQWRDTENGGLTIDSSGSYTFADGMTKNWTDSVGLMQVLANNPQTQTCFAKKVASFALQRDMVANDMPRSPLNSQWRRQQLREADDGSARQKRCVPDLRRGPVMRKNEGDARPVVEVETGRLQGFRLSDKGVRKNAINRRAFLRGAGTVAVGLPFLEGLPERSAWAAGAPPVFTMMMVGSGGVVGKNFFPDATGRADERRAEGDARQGRVLWRRTRRT